MTDYTPPLNDILFALYDVVDLGGVARLGAFGHCDRDLVESLLVEHARFVTDTLAPLNRSGDREGCQRHEDGSVSCPRGFDFAYRQYTKSGWGALHFPEEHGGAGLPRLVGTALEETLAAANLAFSLCPMLTRSGCEMLIANGSPWQKDTFLHPLIAGEWTATMAMTEPDAGSDVGAVRARATPAGGDEWRVSGQKIFVTYGEHDLAENIVHFVLARAPGAPPGTRGLSCFAVPKFLPGGAGIGGARNGVTCLGIEEKLGIHASPTCVLQFDNAVAYLIGQPHQGMHYMFTMMNHARLSIGIEGLAVATRAYQKAAAYARERRQGRALGAPAGSASAIVAHADVRRMLMTQRSYIEALRGVAYYVAESADFAAHDPDEEARAFRQGMVDILTPVVKAWGTDLGVELSSLALQVHGGPGYIEETGMAQLFRDARICPIYEGTNGIQAIDLATRKIPMRGGAVVRRFLAEVEASEELLASASAGQEQALVPLAQQVASARQALSEATGSLLRAQNEGRTGFILAGATPYLRMLGLVAGGWAMARQALAASRALARGTGDEGFMGAKLATARFYCEQVLPQAAGLLPAVTAGDELLFALGAGLF